MLKHHEEQLYVSVLNDTCYNRFISVHNSCTEPLLVWKAAFTHYAADRVILHALILQRICSVYAVKSMKKRERFWNYISCIYDVTLEVELFNKSDEDFVNCILGGKL